MKVFSVRLRELRENSGLSQKRLAEILHTTNSSVCDWERGRAEPALKVVVEISDYFGVSCDYLLGKTDY
ncbi:MAG: helix-turn-helix transcriptional regulator [Clostridiales bacterium]|nr:helix-turn-helix transcriptional regulator [Clostridiales bacterium]